MSDVAAIRKIAIRHARRIERVTAIAWRAGMASIDPARIEGALATGGGVEAVEPILRQGVEVALRRLRAGLPSALRATMTDAANLELQGASRRGGFVAAQDDDDVSTRRPFGDLEDLGYGPMAQRAAEEQTAELLDILGRSMFGALLLLLTLGLAAAVAPRILARRVQQSIGLREDSIRAVENLATELRTAKPGRLVTRFRPRPGVRSRPGFRVRIPAGGATEAWIELQLSRYRAMLVNLRARMIGRTEAARAAQAGIRLLWQQALAAGLLPAGVRRRWLTANDARVCPVCRSLEGQTVALDEPFQVPGGRSIFAPPQHPQCRCTTVLITNPITTNQKEVTKMAMQFRTTAHAEMPRLRACGNVHGGECGDELPPGERVLKRRKGPSPAELADRRRIIADAKRKLQHERAFHRTQTAQLSINQHDGPRENEPGGVWSADVLFAPRRALTAEELEWQRSMPSPPDPYERAIEELKQRDRASETGR